MFEILGPEQSQAILTNAHFLALEDADRKIDILGTRGTCGALAKRAQPRLLHVYGHVHAHHGVRLRHSKDTNHAWYQVAAPIMDHTYDPSQVPIVVDIPRPVSRPHTASDR